MSKLTHEELIIAVAREVMGWTPCSECKEDFVYPMFSPQGDTIAVMYQDGGYWETWAPLDSLDGVWEVLEKLGQGCYVRIR